MKYFAYGSNMSIARLTARAPCARRIGVYTLFQHSLRFHKKSKDGSGKCDAYETGNAGDAVIGVLFEISQAEKRALDRAEGLGQGYDEKHIRICGEDGATIEAYTYYATLIDACLKPYSWYLNHVIVGATENQLPVGYLQQIQTVQTMVDPDSEREAAERAVHSLP